MSVPIPSRSIPVTLTALELAALMDAARRGATEFILRYLRRGVDINIQDNEGNTLLYLAVLHTLSHSDLAETLVMWGADPNVQDSSGNTLLHRITSRIAPGFNASRIVKFLIDHKADPLILNVKQQLAIDCVYTGDKNKEEFKELSFYTLETIYDHSKRAVKEEREPYQENRKQRSSHEILRSLALAGKINRLYQAKCVPADFNLKYPYYPHRFTSQDYYQCDPLSYAYKKNNSPVIFKLIYDAGADPIHLIYGISHSDLSTTKALIFKFDDVNRVCDQQCCSESLYKNLLSGVLSFGPPGSYDLDIVQLLLKRKANPNVLRMEPLPKRTTNTLLQETLYKSYKNPELHADIAESLLAAKATVGIPSSDVIYERTGLPIYCLSAPLHMAAYFGGALTRLIPKLIGDGITVNTPGENGDTALLLACEKGQVSTISMLLELGSDPNFANAHGIGEFYGPRKEETSLFVILNRENSLILIPLLAAYGTDLNRLDREGNTLLHLTNLSKNNHLFLLHILGANLDIKNKAGKTPEEKYRNYLARYGQSLNGRLHFFNILPAVKVFINKDKLTPLAKNFTEWFQTKYKRNLDPTSQPIKSDQEEIAYLMKAVTEFWNTSREKFYADNAKFLKEAKRLLARQLGSRSCCGTRTTKNDIIAFLDSCLPEALLGYSLFMQFQKKRELLAVRKKEEQDRVVASPLVFQFGSSSPNWWGEGSDAYQHKDKGDEKRSLSLI